MRVPAVTCVCERDAEGVRATHGKNMCVSVREWACVSVYVRVSEYVSMCICLGVCVCLHEKRLEREKERTSQ